MTENECTAMDAVENEERLYAECGPHIASRDEQDELQELERGYAQDRIARH